MASKKTKKMSKTDLRNSIRSQFIGEERELFELLVAHYVRGEAQRKRIIGDYNRTMDPERTRAVAMAAIEYLADSPKRANDGRYPRQIEVIARASLWIGQHQLPPGAWRIVAIEIVEEDCPETQRGTRG